MMVMMVMIGDDDDNAMIELRAVNALVVDDD
jgi:hypothetical protein